MLAIPKALGLGPVLSALLLNIPAGWLLFWLAGVSDPSRARWFQYLVGAYLVLLIPFAGIVQLDVVAAAFLASALVLVMRTNTRKPATYALATGLCAAAVSTKPQYALVIWAMLGLLAVGALLSRKKFDRMTRVLAITLLVGGFLGFALDNGLRALSGRSEAIRTTSAVTLYAGLLVSKIEGCGYWSRDAAQAAKADKDKPLLTAIEERLSAKPAGYWFSVMQCKLPEILRPDPFAFYWLKESPNVQAWLGSLPDQEQVGVRVNRIIYTEIFFYSLVTGLIQLAAAIGIVVAWKRGGRKLLALVPLAWMAAFWAVHLVFEIQGRYFLGMFLLAPLLTALVIRASHQSDRREVASA